MFLGPAGACQGRDGAGMVILFEPLIDDGLGLAGGAKPFGVENLSAKGSVEALIVAVLPR